MDTKAISIIDHLQRLDPASSPMSAPAIIGIALICGIVLWLCGKQVLKPIVAILGGAFGSAFGILAPTVLGISNIGQVPASLAGLGVGAILGLLVGLALYRTVIAFGTGLSFGAAGLLASLALLSGPVVQAEPDTTDTAATATAPEQTIAQDQSESSPQLMAQRAVAFVKQTGSAVTKRYRTLDQDDRLRVLGATLGSLIFGLIAGLAAPGRASAVVTSAFGSGVWLYCFAWLSTQQSAPWASSLNLGPRGWAISWAVATLVGIAAQLLLWPKRVDAKPGDSAA